MTRNRHTKRKIQEVRDEIVKIQTAEEIAVKTGIPREQVRRWAKAFLRRTDDDLVERLANDLPGLEERARLERLVTYLKQWIVASKKKGARASYPDPSGLVLASPERKALPSTCGPNRPVSKRATRGKSDGDHE